MSDGKFLRSVTLRIVLVLASMLILVGVTLIGWIMATSDDRDVVVVKLDAGESQTVTFDEVGMVPGSVCEYDIELRKDNARKYDLTLDFIDKVEEMTLKNYVRVRVVANDDVVVCDDLLATAIEKDDITLPVDFDEEKNTNFKVIYYLPVNVGNEAKNAEAVFELVLTAVNE